MKKRIPVKVYERVAWDKGDTAISAARNIILALQIHQGKAELINGEAYRVEVI